MKEHIIKAVFAPMFTAGSLAARFREPFLCENSYDRFYVTSGLFGLGPFA